MDRPRPPGRQLEPGQRSQLCVGTIEGGDPLVVWESAEALFEAPNWTPDGKSLVVNQEGALYRIAPEPGGRPERIPIEGDMAANNDHVLSPDGSTIYISAFEDGLSQLYAAPLVGGGARRISNTHATRFNYFLHGISPDGRTLAYVAVALDAEGRRLPSNTYTIPAAGGPDTRLTDHRWNDDGPEYTPDGGWIYLNSERPSGQMQVCRMRPDGSAFEPITTDERVNWFPHPSPGGEWIQYLSYPPGTDGHPANRDVIVRLMRPDGRERRDLYRFNGGQGTTNVNGWAPDSRRFAYVAYPLG
jgi:Tol biopolymer transport system component